MVQWNHNVQFNFLWPDVVILKVYVVQLCIITLCFLLIMLLTNYQQRKLDLLPSRMLTQPCNLKVHHHHISFNKWIIDSSASNHVTSLSPKLSLTCVSRVQELKGLVSKLVQETHLPFLGASLYHFHLIFSLEILKVL